MSLYVIYVLTTHKSLLVLVTELAQQQWKGSFREPVRQYVWYVLNKKGLIKAPTSKTEWLNIATEFDYKRNFPDCLGAIDGKHIITQAPLRSGSTFFNYKKIFSIVLLVVCNANYEFTQVDIGETGRESDRGIYSSSKLGMTIDRNLLNIPEPTTTNEYSVTNKFPFVLVAGEAFALKPFMLQPFPGRNDLNLCEFIFNNRLSRAMRLLKTPSGY